MGENVWTAFAGHWIKYQFSEALEHVGMRYSDERRDEYSKFKEVEMKLSPEVRRAFFSLSFCTRSLRSLFFFPFFFLLPSLVFTSTSHFLIFSCRYVV
jgi:hypothetical protein